MCFSSALQYYIAARHMALAKAFPDIYMYEPEETASVSQLVFLWMGDLLEIIITYRSKKSFQLHPLMVYPASLFSSSGLRLPLPTTCLRAAISFSVPPLLPAPQRGRGQRWRGALRRGCGGGEGPREHPPACRAASPKQVCKRVQQRFLGLDKLTHTLQRNYSHRCTRRRCRWGKL